MRSGNGPRPLDGLPFTDHVGIVHVPDAGVDDDVLVEVHRRAERHRGEQLLRVPANEERRRAGMVLRARMSIRAGLAHHDHRGHEHESQSRHLDLLHDSRFC